MPETLKQLLEQVRNCRICEAHLPLGPRPVLRASKSSRIAIIGQAPGTKVHNTGIPWNDQSGIKLREWLDMKETIFYNENLIAIIPMGFCYPGKGKSGDLPPRPECAPEWHNKLFQKLPNVELYLLAGTYAVNYYLPGSGGLSLAKTIQNTNIGNGGKFIPLVHPSPRNRLWLRNNTWFENAYIPKVRKRVKEILNTRA